MEQINDGRKANNYENVFWICSACLWLFSLPALAEDKNARQAPILKLDTAYWRAFNSAQPAGMNAHLAEDVEFYHDRGGIPDWQRRHCRK